MVDVALRCKSTAVESRLPKIVVDADDDDAGTVMVVKTVDVESEATVCSMSALFSPSNPRHSYHSHGGGCDRRGGLHEDC